MKTLWILLISFLGIGILILSFWLFYFLGNINGRGYIGRIEALNNQTRCVEACFQTSDGKWNIITIDAMGKGNAYWTESPIPFTQNALVKKVEKDESGRAACKFVTVGERRSGPNKPTK